MLRKTILALFAVALIGMLSPAVASARGGFVGGGFRGGSFAGGSGWRGGGWRGGGQGWRGAAYGAAVGVGLGLAGSFFGYPYGDEDDYPYGYGEYAEYGPWAYRGCYLARQRVWTSHGWRLRAVQVCD
jgi:hypothetical protein